MRFLKLAFISAVILFLLATVLGLLLPNKVVVSRAMDFNANKDSIFYLMKNVENWKEWIAGMSNDNVKIISSTEAILNETNVKITSTENYQVYSLWTGKKGTTQESIMRVIQDSNSTAAVVQWQFTEKLKWYPWQRFGSMMNETMIGTQLETNLANLKKIIEK